MGGSYKVRQVYRDEGYYQLLKCYDQWEEDSDARERVQNVIYIIIQDDGEVDLRREDELPEGYETHTELEVVDNKDENKEVVGSWERERGKVLGF